MRSTGSTDYTLTPSLSAEGGITSPEAHCVSLKAQGLKSVDAHKRGSNALPRIALHKAQTTRRRGTGAHIPSPFTVPGPLAAVSG